ncbi:MAG: heavy metal translocating P-type ATPase [Planctomycetes bacterium]|nr:heavy metal translocating P-type ATPase [Planctomycetota bacterium]
MTSLSASSHFESSPAASRFQAASATCAHCGQPVPGAASVRSESFCCAGCEAVWHMLHECGLEKYYALQRENGFAANRPNNECSLSYLDHAEFQQRHVQQLDDGRLRAELRLDGLKCGACLWLLEALPRLQGGLLGARVDLGRSVIALEWLPGQTSLSAVARRIASLGYEVRPVGTLASRSEWRRQDRRWLVHIAVAGAISGNVMAIAFALYGAHFAWMDDPTRQFLQWTSVALAGLSVAWPGRMFLSNAMGAIRTRTPHMDLPIALALLAGLLGGAAMTLANRPGVYFESVSMLVFLLLVGRFVQFRQQRSARHDLELICALVPQSARRLAESGALEEVPTEALRPGDLVEISAGGSVCADGTLEAAAAHFDMQLLTGESRPIRVGRGEAVYAGVRLLDSSPARVRVSTLGSETRAAAIAHMVESAAGARPRVVEFANRIAGWFLLSVVVAASATGIAWWLIDPSRALSVVIAMLVVTCPCALGLATPLTMVASLGRAARAGILVRGGDVFERLARSGTLVLDKTGTVTEGRMRVVRELGDRKAIALAAALETHSAHPIARAMHDHYGEKPGVAPSIVGEVEESLGAGIRGMVDGHRVKVGNFDFIKGDIGLQDTGFATEARTMVQDGLTPIYISVEGALRSVIAMGDPLRSDAGELVAGLARRGWRVWLASGDIPEIAAKAGATLGLAKDQVFGACTPERKLEIVSGLQPRPVVMVGDGVNDLPAMAAADVGVAVRQGARATLECADVALTGGGLGQVVALLDGARRTMATIHVNFAISLAYNLLGGALAATGVINPLIAAVLMPLSGLTVTAVALRMPRFRSDAAPQSEAHR